MTNELPVRPVFVFFERDQRPQADRSVRSMAFVGAGRGFRLQVVLGDGETAPALCSARDADGTRLPWVGVMDQATAEALSKASKGGIAFK